MKRKRRLRVRRFKGAPIIASLTEPRPDAEFPRTFFACIPVKWNRRQRRNLKRMEGRGLSFPINDPVNEEGFIVKTARTQ